MKFHRPTRAALRKHCAELGDDDGLNPRDDFRRDAAGPRQSRKSRQLCKQVAQALDFVLSGDCPEEVLRNLQIVAVEPAPYSSRLLVTLAADVPEGQFDPKAILAGLDRHAGRLRCEVAASIRRKKAPLLLFHVVGKPCRRIDMERPL